MANVDIVARLQLRAEQFSSEAGRATADIAGKMTKAAGEIRQPFVAAFADVSRMAQQALTMPRTSGGSLDLSSEIASLNKAAQAADQRATAAREMSVALTAAAAAGKGDAEALRLDADAAAVASLAAERDAAAIRRKAEGYQAANVELSKVTSATQADARAQDESTQATGRNTVARAMLQHQMRAISDSFASGMPVSMIFGQHIASIGEMLALYGMNAEKGAKDTEHVGESMTETGKSVLENSASVKEAGEAVKGFGAKAAAVGDFMAGPWGLAIIAATTVMGPLVLKWVEGNHALDDAVDKLREEAEGAEVNRQAKEKFSRTVEGVTAAIEAQLEAQGKAIDAEKTAAERDNIAAKLEMAKLIRIRQITDALLEQAIAQERVANTTPTGGVAGTGTYIQGGAAGRVDELIAFRDANRAKIATAETTLNNSRVELASEQAKTGADPQKRINKNFDDQERAARAAARGNDALTASLYQTIKGIEARRKAEIEAEQEREKKPRKPREVSLGDQLDAEEGQRLLSAAQRYSGLNENRDKGALEKLFEQAHQSVDPSKVAWCAAFVNAILAGASLPTTGSLSARSFLGYGSATDKPEKGDIVVLRSDRGAASGHVGFFAGLDGKGNVRVTGGNQGNEVSTETFKRSDVLGFRRAPSAADSYKTEEEAANRAVEAQRRLGDDILRTNAEWDEQPRLIDRAAIETHKLDEIIADLSKQPVSAETTKLIAEARAAKQAIENGLDRPFQQFVRVQTESVAIQQLVLQGRDAEAQALEWALRLQETQGPLDDAHLAKLLQMAQRQQAISDALEDQRRVVGLYGSAVGEIERTVDQFLDDLTNKPKAALGNLAQGFVSNFRKLQNNLISEQLFGGMQREIERYVAQRGGGTTPADMLRQQLTDAGGALHDHVDQSTAALTDFTSAVRYTTEMLLGSSSIQRMAPAGYVAKDLLSPSTIADLTAGAAAEAGRPAANDNTLVEATRDLAHATEAAANKHMSAAELYDHIGARLVSNFEQLVGIKLPKSVEGFLDKHLGSALQGASNGQLGGSIFSAITGGKQNALASGVGGVLGQEAGKALTKPLGDLFGKTIGNMAGPLGGIVGGVLGNLVGGLFSSPKWSNATIGMNAYGSAVGTTGTGKGSEAIAAATGVSSSVAAGINQLADQLGARITSLPALTLGTWDGKYRVADLATSKALNANNFSMGNNLHDFGQDQQAAIEYAVRYSISHAVISGISQASKNILANGSTDLQSAINKALLIEAVPRDLKAMLDPVGAAIDSLNLKWQRTVDALKEGGATAEQMAQAQRLYNMQLDQVKASTDAADKTLKDFMTSLKMGSSSPYSLRDQEGTALANLQPFLDSINAGKTIDQGKYQTAAQSYLDIERQLYGSTQQYFDAMDAVQAATNKAIATIDNATPVKASVDSPFIQATATNTSDANDLLSQMSGQLGDISALLASLGGATGTGSFIGDTRGFSAIMAA